MNTRKSVTSPVMEDLEQRLLLSASLKALHFKVISDGAFSAQTAAVSKVIDNAQELDELRGEVDDDALDQEEDLVNNTMVSVFMGQQVGLNYDTRVKRVVETATQIVVQVEQQVPPAGNLTPMIVTQPYQVIMIKQAATKPVVFETSTTTKLKPSKAANVTNAIPSGLSPAQVRAAYGVDQVAFGGGIVGDGSGQTIALVNANLNKNIAKDLAVFNQQFGLPTTDSAGKPVLTVAKMKGAKLTDPGWALEMALDVQWAHAMAPKAHILLVQAASGSLLDMTNAVDYARKQPGVSVVSMSWGGSEWSSEGLYDSLMLTPAGHAPVTFLASSGDSGNITSWPSVCPTVVSVGGTTLTLSGTGAYVGESAWSGSGGGPSLYVNRPGFQAGVPLPGNRLNPDVALVADPATGVAVYSSIPLQGRSGWFRVGGTSASSPMWGGLIAIANQGRVAAGKATLDGVTDVLPAAYSFAADFRDVTSGSNGYAAGAGYDMATGLGSPVLPDFITALVNA